MAPLTKKYRVIGLCQRPLWPNSDPKKLKSWKQLADDLILFFDQQNLKQVIGVGHSLGAVVSAFAAMKRPDLFRRLILLEPVLFPQFFQWILTITPISIRQKIIPIAKIANKRRDQWPNREILFNGYRKKRIFRDLSDEAINDWIDHGTFKDPQGNLRLSFPKAWESRIYATVPYIIDDLIKIPVHILRGEHTEVISTKIWKKLNYHLPSQNLWNLENASHLAPLEFPEKISKWIMDSIQ